jgi:hypothetical protein
VAIINFLKLDFKITKNAFLLISGVIIISLLISPKDYIITLYLNAFPILLSGLPFSNKITYNTLKMYLLFPSKISNMILARYLYLFSIFCFTTIVNIFLIMFLNNNSNIYHIVFIESFSLIICLINYLLQYSLNINYTFKDSFSGIFFFIFSPIHLITLNLINILTTHKILFLLILIFSIFLFTGLSIYFSIKSLKKNDLYD